MARLGSPDDHATTRTPGQWALEVFTFDHTGETVSVETRYLDLPFRPTSTRPVSLHVDEHTSMVLYPWGVEPPAGREHVGLR